MRGSALVCGLAAVVLSMLGGCDSSPAPRGEKIELKLNLKPGDKRRLTADMDLNIDAQAKRQRQKVNMSMSFGMSFEVLDVDDEGVHTLKTTYDRVRVKISGGPQTIAYDSDSPGGGQDPMGQVFGAMVGSTLTLKVTPDGQTLDVQGMEEMADKMADKLPPQARAGFEQQMEGMTNSFDQMMSVLPRKPVDIRDTWSGSMNMAADPNMPMKVDATYTLYDRKDGVAIVKVDGKIKGGKGLSGTMKGTMRIDEKTGWTEGGEMTMNMEGRVEGVDMEMDGEIKFGS